MKKLFILFLTLMAFGSLKAYCAVMSVDQVKSIIAKEVVKNSKKYTDAELSVKVSSLPFCSLEVPEGKVSFIVQSAYDKFMPRDLEKVTVLVNDKPVKTFNAPVVIQAYKDVLVASTFIPMEQELNSSVVQVKRMEISHNMQYALNASLINNGILAKKSYREGELIDKRYTKIRPDVHRNANVMVIFNTNNLSVSTEAIALSSGSIGDSICLINKIYNKVYTGKIIGENKVMVKI